MALRIAVLQSDKNLAAHIGRLLAKAGHTTSRFRSGKSLLEGLQQEAFDLLLLEWGLPDCEGNKVLHWVKENLRPSPPVIIIAEPAEEANIVIALSTGAADYVSKPLQDEVLEARVAGVLQRRYGGKARLADETYGAYVLHPSKSTVTIGGHPVKVSVKDFALALLLFQNLSRPLSRRQIGAAVWGEELDASSRTLDAHVSRIRIRLGLRPENGLRLSSVYGFGYRMDRVQEAA